MRGASARHSVGRDAHAHFTQGHKLLARLSWSCMHARGRTTPTLSSNGVSPAAAEGRRQNRLWRRLDSMQSRRTVAHAQLAARGLSQVPPSLQSTGPAGRRHALPRAPSPAGGFQHTTTVSEDLPATPAPNDAIGRGGQNQLSRD